MKEYADTMIQSERWPALIALDIDAAAESLTVSGIATHDDNATTDACLSQFWSHIEAAAASGRDVTVVFPDIARGPYHTMPIEIEAQRLRAAGATVMLAPLEALHFQRMIDIDGAAMWLGGGRLNTPPTPEEGRQFLRTTNPHACAYLRSLQQHATP